MLGLVWLASLCLFVLESGWRPEAVTKTIMLAGSVASPRNPASLQLPSWFRTSHAVQDWICCYFATFVSAATRSQMPEYDECCSLRCQTAREGAFGKRPPQRVAPVCGGARCCSARRRAQSLRAMRACMQLRCTMGTNRSFGVVGFGAFVKVECFCCPHLPFPPRHGAGKMVSDLSSSGLVSRLFLQAPV